MPETSAPFRVAINTKVSQDEARKDSVGNPFPVMLVDEATGEDLALVTLQPPSSSMLLLMMATLEGSSHKRSEMASMMINYFMHQLDEEDARLVMSLLLDREVSFSIEQIGDILSASVEAWSAHPTEPSSGSSASQPRYGQVSMQRGVDMESISSTSAPTGSSTSSSQSYTVESVAARAVQQKQKPLYQG